MRRASAEEWARRVEQWRRSGQTAREFSEGKDFTLHSLRWWSAELNRRGVLGRSFTASRASKPRPKFARVLRSPSRHDGGVTLRVSGVEVVVERGFDTMLLAEVVRALGGHK